MQSTPDTTIVDLHRTSAESHHVSQVEGRAWRIPKDLEQPHELSVGMEVVVGDTVALAPQAVVDIGPFRVKGGRRGRAHSLVNDAAFRPSPCRKDVPRLLLQLSELERQQVEEGEDLLQVAQCCQTPFERAASAEFARQNYVSRVAVILPEDEARALRAVPLFISHETAFVAMSSVDLGKLRALIEALQQPVTPHMVEDRVIEELIQRSYPS